MNQQPKKHPRKASDGTQKAHNVTPIGKWHDETALGAYRKKRDTKNKAQRKARKRNR